MNDSVLRDRMSLTVYRCASKALLWAVMGMTTSLAVANSQAIPLDGSVKINTGSGYSTLRFDHADVRLTLSNGALDPRSMVPPAFPGGAVGALNIVQAHPVALETSQLTETRALIGSRVKTDVRVGVEWRTNGRSLQIDSMGPSALWHGLTMSAGVRIDVPDMDVSGPGGIELRNVVVRFDQRAIFGDIAYGSGGDAQLIQGVKLWNYADSQGPVDISSADLSAMMDALYGQQVGSVAGGWSLLTEVDSGYAGKAGVFQSTTTIRRLTATDEFEGLLMTALNVPVGGMAATSFANISDWGVLDIAWSVGVGTPEALSLLSVVPEPSTYALMGLGLVGVFAVSRRRA